MMDEAIGMMNRMFGNSRATRVRDAQRGGAAVRVAAQRGGDTVSEVEARVEIAVVIRLPVTGGDPCSSITADLEDICRRVGSLDYLSGAVVAVTVNGKRFAPDAWVPVVSTDGMVGGGYSR